MVTSYVFMEKRGDVYDGDMVIGQNNPTNTTYSEKDVDSSKTNFATVENLDVTIFSDNQIWVKHTDLYTETSVGEGTILIGKISDKIFRNHKIFAGVS